MSGSRRKTPILGHTTCESEKDDKVLAHRAERRAVKIALLEGDEIPPPEAFGDPWKAGKDGKFWWAKAKPKDMRK